MALREGYGAIPQRVQPSEPENAFVPGSEDVNIFPERWRRAPGYIILIILVCLFGYTLLTPNPARESAFEAIVWDSYNRSVLKDVAPIAREEFLERQDKLARLLAESEADAFISEPGGTTQYFANFSTDMWGLSERPFLFVMTPREMFILAPLFEISRAKLLCVPSRDTLKFVTWAEDTSPLKALLHHLPLNVKVMVDDNVRSFITQGLEALGAKVLIRSPNISAIRETKSPAEIAILRAVNIATVEAIRAIQRHIVIGMSELMVRSTLDNILQRAGLTPYFNIVLFGSDAANPHGGVDESRQLQECEFILIDVGSTFRGYSSDITRTFLPKRTNIDSCRGTDSLKLLWNAVYDAQSAAIQNSKLNHTCASVDLAARRTIEDAGFGKYFTHRVGHGLGIEGHEPPYLNKGNTNTRMRAGNVITVEPGVYIEGKLGIRLEDVIMITENGPELLSGDRATDWLHP